jgi:hypothetical protein
VFRFWLASSIFWAVIAGWIVYDRHATALTRAAEQQVCVDQRKRDPKLGNPFDCFNGSPLEFDDLLPWQWHFKQFVILLVPPIGGTLLLGAVVLWVGAGFRRHPRLTWLTGMANRLANHLASH